MTSYWSSLLTTTTSRVASIRQNLLSSENDGDTDDDTHICRVLRSYYTEKGRSFPTWLPPDPKAPPPTIIQPVYAPANPASKYGGPGMQTSASTSFASLFGNGNDQSNAQETSSLRQTRDQPRMGRDHTSGDKINQFNKTQAIIDTPIVQSRPLPSKMAGSYQTANIGLRGNTQSSVSLGNQKTQPMSAKDRLKAGNLRRNDPRKPNSTDPFSSNRLNNDKSEKPFVAATSPWASNETEFGGGGYETPSEDHPHRIPNGSTPTGKKIGLPSRPRGVR